MAIFEVVVKTVFEVDSESEYKARTEAFQAASRCQEELYDKFQLTGIVVQSSYQMREFVPEPEVKVNAE